MITRKQFITSAFGIMAAGTLVACGGSGTSDSGASEEQASTAEGSTLLVAASPSPTRRF